MRWAFGAIAAVLGAMVVLPGVASAHHVNLDGSLSCENGNWEMHANYSGGGNNEIIFVQVEGDDFGSEVSGSGSVDDDFDEYGLDTTVAPQVDFDGGGTDDNQFNYQYNRDRFEIDGHGDAADATDGLNSFFRIDGHFDDVDAQPDDAITLATQMYGAEDDDDLDDTSIPDSSNPLQDSDSLTISVAGFADCLRDVCVEIGESGTYQNDTQYDWLVDENGLCVQIQECVDGNLINETLPEGQTPVGTRDCDAIVVCVNGATQSVTEFDQAELDLEKGPCQPQTPPQTPPPSTPPVTPPVTQVAAAVSEVLPARLPSTGSGGPGATSSFGWGAAFAVVLLGLGATAALMARRQES